MDRPLDRWRSNRYKLELAFPPALLIISQILIFGPATIYAGNISEEIIDKIFEKNFTTKGEKGSGIGLSMTKEIIEDFCNGELHVENTDDEMCCFDEILKACEDIMPQLKGSYAALFLADSGDNPFLFAITDPHKIRPLVLGKSNGMYCLTSETRVFKKINFEYIKTTR